MAAARPFRGLLILVIWSGVVGLLYSLGAFILSNGWSWIDSSPQRDFLYTVHSFLLPAAIGIGLVHFFWYVLTKQIAIMSTAVAVVSGFIGLGLLDLAVRTSNDPVASMAYNAGFIVFCGFAVVGFVVATIVQVVCHALSRKSKA